MCRRKECEIKKNVIRSLSEENLNRYLYMLSCHLLLEPSYNIQGKITHKFISSHTTQQQQRPKKYIQNDSHMEAKRSPKIYIICIKIKYENKSIKEFLMVYHKF